MAHRSVGGGPTGPRSDYLSVCHHSPPMSRRLAEGVYEHLVTEAIERDLAGLAPEIQRAIEHLSEADGHLALARHLGQQVARVLGSLPQKERLEIGRELV